MTYAMDEIIRIVCEAVDSLRIERRPRALYEPVEYALACGGKRLRPTLTLLAYNLWRDDVREALTPALALETYHNYTLLHDDLMDNADVRRGRPTVHRRWDANTAILSGDAMLTYAMHLMTQVADRHLRPLVEMLTVTALEVCEGQQYDMDFETRDDVAEDEYMEMIRLKTSVLLAAALKAGAVMADAPAEDIANLYAFGEKLGLAFQLQDDYLDVYGDPATFGKRIGGDILCGKKTFMLINAVRMADAVQRAELGRLLASQPEADADQEAKIAAVTHIYNILGVADVAKERMQRCYEEAMESLARVTVDDERKKPLREFASRLMTREK